MKPTDKTVTWLNPEKPLPNENSTPPAKRQWWDGCRYECAECPAKRNDSDQMADHVREEHSSSSSVGGYRTLETSVWQCKACPEDAAEASGEEEVCELLTRQRSTVERHLREEHKLTIENYEKAVEGR